MVASSLSHTIARVAENVARDLVYAGRSLRRNAGFTAVAVGILAVGIGANLTIFRFVSALLLQPPPVNSPDELLQIWNLNSRAHSAMERYVPLNYPDYAYFRDHNRSFSGLLAFDGDPNTVSWMRGGHGEMAQAQFVSGNFFAVLGLSAAVGTLALPADDASSAGAATVVVSHRFWRTRLGADPSVAGSAININGVTFIVSGIAPPGFSCRAVSRTLPGTSHSWICVLTSGTQSGAGATTTSGAGAIYTGR